jgi:hypothetical protein
MRMGAVRAADVLASGHVVVAHVATLVREDRSALGTRRRVRIDTALEDLFHGFKNSGRCLTIQSRSAPGDNRTVNPVFCWSPFSNAGIDSTSFS